jgi:hypothetical protein
VVAFKPTFRTPTQCKIDLNCIANELRTLDNEYGISLLQLQLGSHGLIAGMIDELGLSELIDTVIKQDHEQRQISVGQCVKAMILNGLGFVNRAL